MNRKREKKTDKTRGYHKALDIAYNEASGALKTIDVRYKISNGGQPANTALGFEIGAIVALFNSDASNVHFYRTGNASVTAPTGYTDGVPIPPRSFAIVPLGDDAYIISDSNLVFCYTVDEDSHVL